MERDFRVRAFLYISNQGQAQGLYNHVQGTRMDAVDINPEMPFAEIRKLELGDSFTVTYNLCFPPDKQTEAEGLFNHSKNLPGVSKLPGASPDEETGFVSMERCGHRTKQPCEITERYDVP